MTLLSPVLCLLLLASSGLATVLHFAGVPGSNTGSYHYHSEPLTTDMMDNPNRPFVEFEGRHRFTFMCSLQRPAVECNGGPVSWILIASDISGLSRFQVRETSRRLADMNCA